MKRAALSVIGLVVLASLVPLLAESPPPPGAKPPTATATAPTTKPAMDVPKLMENTKIPELKAAEAKALGQYAGEKGVLLLFVDTKCPFGAQALKEMPGVAKALTAQKVNSVVINSDDAKDVVEAFYAKTNPGTPVLFDVTAGTRKAWDVNAVPLAVYVTADKTIAYSGKATWKDVGAAVEKALELKAGTIKFTAGGTGGG